MKRNARNQNTIKYMKIAFDGLIGRLEMDEERINKVEDTPIEISRTQIKKKINKTELTKNRISKNCAIIK